MNTAISHIESDQHSQFCSATALPQSILICDPNPILASGMQHILQRAPYLSKYDIRVEARPDLQELKELAPDIVIIDPWQGIEVWHATADIFRDLSKITSLIFYCPDISPTEARAIGSIGFRGIMPKTIEGEELVRIVSAVAFGGIYLHDIYCKDLSTPAMQLNSTADLSPDLTERELQVLRHVALGRSIKEIAAALNISTKTVDTYRTRANLKLNLRTRPDIVQYAIQSGWMS